MLISETFIKDINLLDNYAFISFFYGIIWDYFMVFCKLIISYVCSSLILVILAIYSAWALFSCFNWLHYLLRVMISAYLSNSISFRFITLISYFISEAHCNNKVITAALRDFIKLIKSVHFRNIYWFVNYSHRFLFWET